MSVILNALNSVWSDHNPANTRKVDKNFQEKLILKIWNLPSKLEIFTKVEKILELVYLVNENNEKYLICVKKYFQKTCWFIIDRGEKARGFMFLSKVLRHSCMIMYCIAEENLFAVIVYRYLLQQKY